MNSEDVLTPSSKKATRNISYKYNMGAIELYLRWLGRKQALNIKTCLYGAAPRVSGDFPLGSSHEPPLIQNAVIRVVTVAMCAAMHHLMKMPVSTSDI